MRSRRSKLSTSILTIRSIEMTRLFFVLLGLSILGYLMKPDESHFYYWIQQVASFADANPLVAFLISSLTALKLPAGQFYDLGIASAMIFKASLNKAFLGLYGIWIPLPRAVISLFALNLFEKCRYRGVLVGATQCLCLPGWSGSNACRKLPGFVSLNWYFPRNVFLPNLVSDLLRITSVLELGVALCLVIYVFWHLFDAGWMYRHLSLSRWTFSINRWYAAILWPFNHASLLHLVWNLWGLWSVMAETYSLMGGDDFLRYFAFLVVMLGATKFFMDALLETRSAPLYGMQYIILACSITNFTWAKSPGGRFGFDLVSVLANNSREVTRVMLQQVMFEQFATGRVDLIMNLASFASAITYHLIK